ncbi:unnamed protein product [Ceutorhynchus assimilis]|uniref:KICSTOR complex protein SZT2 n=1 Tax=Ceutorhynchus assimilis TaxID=467358 RepID=A0A9N9M836_9CUCU|nr:unnamed protein product [Ceutorhynchus assimilis]
MEFDRQSQCSDEGVELSSDYGLQFSREFLRGEELPPDFLEAKVVYLLLPKNVPVSRVTRLNWLLDHLNSVVTASTTKLLETSQNIEVVSAIAREPNTSTKCTRFLVTNRTEVKFIAHSYRFVYCLDMSPSHATVDIDRKELVFDEILQSFKISIEGLSKHFTIPGNTLVFQPAIYLTIMVNTPFFITPAQQVILKGIQMTSRNVNEIIMCVETHFCMLEGKIADACTQALDKIVDLKATQDRPAQGEFFGSTEKGRLSKIPMVTPDVNFVNMLRYSMLAIYLLPETTLSHILVITDGIVSMPDSNVMETMLHQLHYDSIAVSFLKVGSRFYPQCGAGLVPYVDLLHFFAHSTLGCCLEFFPKIFYDSSMSMNFYHDNFLFWSFHSNSRLCVRNCDNRNSWTGNNDRFYNQRLPILLSKRQTEESTSASLLLLLARRMREGFTVDNIFYINGNLEIKLVQQWKSSIFIHYKLMSQWPTLKNLIQFEVHVCAPYEFLHDMTCLFKKESQSVLRQAIIQRFWSRLSQVSSGDLGLASQLSNFTNNKDWCTLPDTIKSGLPVFNSNNPSYSDSTKLVLVPRDNFCPRFINIWQGICQMETNNWRKWFHTHKISLILTHDTPLPTTLHLSSCSSQRYQVVQCRQAVVALYSMLSEWASFILIDNHTYLKFLYNELNKPPVGFCIVRVSSKFPSAVINLGFSTNTPGQSRFEVCDELKALLSSLSYIPKANEPSCCVLLHKPLEKILIRYERVPNTFTTVVFPDGTHPPDSSSYLSSPVTGSLFTTLSRYLFHKRWIWSAKHPSNLRLPDASISRILNTLTRMRLKEGYQFAYSSSGIVTMVLEVDLEAKSSCLVQYVLFPPYNNWGDDLLSCSDEEMEPSLEQEAELEMITEVWIEPQHGKVVPSHSRISYINNMNYYQIADAIRKIDFRCINVLITMEHISLMCQDKAVHNLTNAVDINNPKVSSSNRTHSRKNSKLPNPDMQNQDVPENGSPWYPIVEPRIENIPFKFDPIELLNLCQQTEMLFSMLREEKANTNKKHAKVDRANKLLLDNIFEHFFLLNDRELELSKKECSTLTKEVIKRHRNKIPHTCPISEKYNNSDFNYQWKCYIKGISVTHVILTFVPASFEDLKALICVETENIPSDLNESDERTSSRESNISDVPMKTPNIMCLPVYVYDCPLRRLVNAYVESENGQSCAPDDVYLDYRFKCTSFMPTVITEPLKNSCDSDDSLTEDSDLLDQRNVREHCNALEMAHSKCFVLSLFLALHHGIYVHNLDVQNAMDLCEEEIGEIDITDYISKMCAHTRLTKTDEIYTQILNEALPCSDLKNYHMIVKKKFFKMVCSSFNQVPSNGEYYFFRHLCVQPEEKPDDSDDEISVCASEIEFRSERDMSIYSEGPHLLEKGLSAGHIDVANMSDVTPLFLHFVCTLRYNNGGHSNTSVRVLPTCLGELIQTLEKPTEFLHKSKIQVTLDIFCLTLPPRVQNILHDYSQQGLRAISFCSDGGYQRTVSTVSDVSINSDVPLPLRRLTDFQKQSVDKLSEEIKWLLEEEICTTLLDIEPVTANTIEYIIDHVKEGHATRPSCKMDKIILNFVYTTPHSHEKFLKEFQQMPLPYGFKLCTVQEYYYIAKDEYLKDSETCVNLSFQTNSSGNFPLDVHEVFKGPPSHVGSTCIEDTMSQQSEITSGSVTGTEGGYDEDVSEDDEDCDWLMTLNNKRAHLPNFWLILRPDQDLVHMYFHCRFIELNSPHVEVYTDVERTVCDTIGDLCKQVNQLLLLHSLYESKSCDSLLEPDDSHSHIDTPSARNYSYNKEIKGYDNEINDDSEAIFSRSMSEASLNLKPGYFSCPVVWEKLFVLHPRLKTGSGNKSVTSRGIMALKNILEKFSVSNRQNMFVYRDKEENVFYLRLYESGNISCGGGRHLFKSAQNESGNVSRSPSITSLPTSQNSKTNLAISDQSIASILSSDNLRPRVRSLGERESRVYDPKDSREKLNEDIIILRVHGITQAGTDVQCDLVQVLQNRLDDAVLEFLSVTLARNSMCPLTPEDVRFIQKPQEPDCTIRLTVQEFPLQWHQSKSFIHYLTQNLLQFLNIPKYTDTRPEFHFKDYSNNLLGIDMPFDNIFIYNQSQTPSSGSRGIACIIMALITNCDGAAIVHSENQFEMLFVTKEYDSFVNSKIIEDKEELPDTYLEFRLWKQGRINIENLSKKLTSAVSQAIWDIVTEYYLLKKPLSVEDYDEKTYFTKKKQEIECLNLDTDVEFNCELDLTFNKNIKPKVKAALPKKMEAHLFSNRKYNKRNAVLSNNLKASRDIVNHDLEIHTSKDNNDNGILSIVFSKYLPSWMEFGENINAPAVKKYAIKLAHRHTPCIIVRELIRMLTDYPKTFRALPTHSAASMSQEIYTPAVSSTVIQKYVIISTSFQKKEQLEDSTNDIANNLKHNQKFVSLVQENLFIPREKMFWISVETDNFVIYTYNWPKENVDKLHKQCTNLNQWLTLRSCYANSAISQKLGLFYNQPLTRKCFMLSANSYYNFISHLEVMSNFPTDLPHTKKSYQSNLNLPMILESFRDNFSNTKYTSTDPVVIFSIEMKEMKSLEKKNRDEMKKLHSMYQSRTGNTSVPQLNLLMQNSRILHYVLTPLLFWSKWRIKAANTRDHTIVSSHIPMVDTLSVAERELWHSELCYAFFCEYRMYLHTLGFTPLQIDNPQAGTTGLWSRDKSLHKLVFYIQRTILGGILIFTVSFEEPFFVTKLYAIECNRLQNITSRSSVIGFTISFLDECDKVKILMHLHSFTYDFHLRSICNYMGGNQGRLLDKYNVRQFLDDFMKYYNKAPNFARNLVYSDTLTIDGLVTEGRQLYDYLILNVNQYDFKVFKMEANPPEYILVQVSTTRQISYMDFQDRQHTNDFDMTLVIYNLCTPYKPTDKVLHLKYYLILTSKRETYPMYEHEQKLGKFRTVSLSGSSVMEYVKKDIDLSLPTSEPEGGGCSNESCDENSLSRSTDEKALIKSTKIVQETVNYLGYYSSHEQIMQKLILDKAKATQKDIRDMVAKGMGHCRTDLLWNRMISPQDSNPLTFDEFMNLKRLAKLTPLSHLHPNLSPLINQPLPWYQGLAKLLLVKYADHHRKFSSPDGRLLYYVILHPRYFGAFMLLSMDIHTSRAELYAVYREQPNKEEGADPLGLGYEKSLRDGFVNCICFYIWSGMIT